METGFSWNEINKIYTDSDKILKLFTGKDIFIFGAGKFGKKFIDEFSHYVHIIGIVDNNIYANCPDNLDGFPIINLDILQKTKGERPIVITSTQYAYDMQLQLLSLGYKLNKDFYIWNPLAWKTMDSYTKSFIEHNHRVWGNCKIKNTKKRILLRHYTWHESIYVDWSYFANFLAKQQGAELWTFGRMDDFSDYSINEIYRSFNVERVLFTELRQEQRERAKTLSETIWKNLHSKIDWLDITVDGYAFGEDICAQYIRGHLDDTCEDIRDIRFRFYLEKMINWIVFWLDYFESHHDIKAVILVDGIYEEGIIRKIAMKHGIDVYGVTVDLKRKWNKFKPGATFWYYKKFYYELTSEEKKTGIQWAKEKLKKRLLGDTSDINYMKVSAYENELDSDFHLPQNGRTKVMICPHCFNDDPYPYGRFLFPDHWEWLCYLGRMSKLTNYDWYLKVHPMANEVDWKMLTMFIERFPNIKMLPHKISPIRLQKEGMQFALTVWGTIGHEYPMFGIQVINAGVNPHIAFDFDWNPMTIEEYEDILLHLDKKKKVIDIQQIYEFYCIHYLYYRGMLDERYDICYKSPELIEKLRPLEGRTKTKRYFDFLQEWNIDRHEQIMKNVESFINEIDSYRDDVFSKKILGSHENE